MANEEKELLFYHEAEESIQLLKRDSTGVYRFDRSIEIGEIDLVSSHIVRTGDDSHLFFLGTDRFWVVPIGRGGWEVETVSTYETDLKDRALHEIGSGGFECRWSARDDRHRCHGACHRNSP